MGRWYKISGYDKEYEISNKLTVRDSESLKEVEGVKFVELLKDGYPIYVSTWVLFDEALKVLEETRGETRDKKAQYLTELYKHLNIGSNAT